MRGEAVGEGEWDGGEERWGRRMERRGTRGGRSMNKCSLCAGPTWRCSGCDSKERWAWHCPVPLHSQGECGQMEQEDDEHENRCKLPALSVRHDRMHAAECLVN